MGSVNKVILVGNLGRDAELRYTPGGAAVANFSLATTETWTDKNSGQRQEHTEWHRVDIWGKRAEALQQHLTKGLRIYVEGSLRTRQWEDRDGNKRSSTDIRADRIEFLDSRGEGGGRRAEGAGESRSQAPAPSEQGAPGGGADLTEDDIPF
ncbi:MAG: single-stranded DNA-binding protein [Acidobacteria bacterium]|nr:single-stranded DNA-binding protein [Acidobacteriota bacterium]